MPLSLPPPLDPQLETFTEAPSTADSAMIPFKTYSIHLRGAPALDPALVKQAISGADTLSNAIRALASAYYAAGYPSALLHYALVDQQVFVRMELVKIVGVDAPPGLREYFDGLPGQGVLTEHSLEPRRALASLYADRAGLDAQPLLVPGDQGHVFSLKPSAIGHGPTSFRSEFGNPANRFVGRYFLDNDLRHGFSTGDELAVFWRTGLNNLNDGTRADDYSEETVALDRITPYGVFGLTGHVIDYKDRQDEATIDNDIDEAALNWLLPLRADFHSRLIGNLRVDYTNKHQSTRSRNFMPQNEEYPSLEAGASYFGRSQALGRELTTTLGLAVRHGLDSAGKGSDEADEDYWLLRPQIQYQIEVGKGLNARLELSGQYSGDKTPEQSQFVLGGVNNLYGYTPGAASGDRGGLARLQLDLPVVDFSPLMLSPRVFAEYGFSRLERPADDEPGGTVELSDVGAELAARFLPWLEASVASAIRTSAGGLSKKMREPYEADVLFRLTANFRSQQ